MKDRILYLDRMKGMAILLVVMGHILMFSMEQGESMAAKVTYAFLAVLTAAALAVAVTYLCIAAGRMLHTSDAINRFVYGRNVFGRRKDS